MQSDIRDVPHTNAVEWRLGGHITPAEIARAYDRLLNHPGWKSAHHLIIIIARDAGLGDITAEEIRAFQTHLLDRQPVLDRTEQRRVAYVCEDPLHIGLLELHRLTFDQYARIAHNAFDDLPSAYAWICETDQAQD